MRARKCEIVEDNHARVMCREVRCARAEDGRERIASRVNRSPFQKRTGATSPSSTKKGVSAEALCRRVSMNDVATNIPNDSAEPGDHHLSALVKCANHGTSDRKRHGRDHAHLQSRLVSGSSRTSSAFARQTRQEGPGSGTRHPPARRVSVSHHLRPVPSVRCSESCAFGRARTSRTPALSSDSVDG